MPGWLWFAIAIALGVVIYLLLRGRRIGGRHQAPAIEYITPEGETVVEPEAEDQVEPVLPTTIASQPDDADDVVRLEEAEREEAEEEELAEGGAQSGRGGVGPEGWTVKGNADSMLFYTDDAPSYRRASADVWFESEEAAAKAGFTRWDAHHR
jgi:hypothetical protein